MVGRVVPVSARNGIGSRVCDFVLSALESQSGEGYTVRSGTSVII